MNTNNKYKRRKRKCNFLLTILILLTTFLSSTATATTDLNSTVILDIEFTTDQYTGYISENVAAVKLYNENSRIINSRTNSRSILKTNKLSNIIYVRFIDLLKPSIRFKLKNENNQCNQITIEELGIELIDTDEQTNNNILFELDNDDSFKCYQLTLNECECPIRIRLRDDSIRDKLNREAKDAYNLQIKLNKWMKSTLILIKILDDNDLDPMFDPNEYTFVLDQHSSSEMPAFTKIGRVIARDPDLSRNSLIRYYINCNELVTGESASKSRELNSNQCNRYFGVDWSTGDIYLKKSLDHIIDALFDANDNENEFTFEVKAVDSGLKLNIANNLLLQTTSQIINNRYNRPSISSNRTSRRFKPSNHDDDDDYDDTDEFYEDYDNNNSEIGNNFKEDDLINYKLIKSAANLKITPTPIKSININNNNNNNHNNRKNPISYYGTSLEAALVKIKLVKDMNKELKFKFIKLADLTNELFNINIDLLNEQIKFKIEKYSDVIIPYALIQTDSIDSIHITSNNDLIKFKLEQIYLPSETQFYLVYIEPSHADLTEIKEILLLKSNLSQIEVSIQTCKSNNKCNSILKFDFKIIDEFISMFENTCSMYLQQEEETNRLILSKQISLNSILFKLNAKFTSVYSSDLMCHLSQMLNESMFHVIYEQIDFTQPLVDLNGQTGIAKLIDYNQNINEFKINIQAYLYFKTLKLKMFKSLTIYYDLIDDSNRFELELSSPFFFKQIKSSNDSIEIIHIKLKSLDDFLQANVSLLKFNNNNLKYDLVYCSQVNCLFYLNENEIKTNADLNPESLNKSMALIVKLHNLDSLKYVKIVINYENIKFEKENCSIRISLSQKQFQDSNELSQLNIFLIKMNIINDNNSDIGEFSLINENIDKLESCILINPKSGNVFLKCKSLNFLKQYEQTQQYKVKIAYKHIVTYLDLIFDLNNNSQNLSDITLFNCLNNNNNTNIRNEILRPNRDLKEILLKKEYTIIDFREAKLKANTTILQIDLRELVNSEDDINTESLFQINNEFELVEDSSSMFSLNKRTGSIRLAYDWQFPFVKYLKHSIKRFEYELKLKLTKSNIIINLIISFKFNDITNLILNLDKNYLPVPRLGQYNYEFLIDSNNLIKYHDYLVLNSIDTYLIDFDEDLNVTDVYELTYSIRLNDINSMELPFYIDSNGKLFYSVNQNNNDMQSPSYKYDFYLIVSFKINGILVHELMAFCQVNVINQMRQHQKSSILKNNKHISLGGSIDLSMSIISAEFISNLQCPLIGFFNNIDKTEKVSYKLIKPKLTLLNSKNSKKNQKSLLRFSLNNNSSSRLIEKSKKKIRSTLNNMDEYIFNLSSDEDQTTTTLDESEKKLLIETFYSQLYLDETTGVLYLNLNDLTENIESGEYHLNNNNNNIHNVNQQYLYSKLAKLINYYLYEKNVPSKRIRVDAMITSEKSQNVTSSIWIDLIFKKHASFISKSDTNRLDIDSTSMLKYENKFQINSNNLLNLFNNGDEFMLALNIEENNNHSDFLNLRKYFESKLDLKRNFINLKLIKQLEYFLVDLHDPYLSNELFSIEDKKSGILVTKPSIQFDYEMQRTYFAKIMIVQHLTSDEIDLNDLNENDNKQVNKFVYWLDLNINIVNVIDEPLVCEEPIYFIDIDESEVKNKKLFTLKLKDYDLNSNTNKSYKSQIIAGNPQGLFSMNDLSLYTGSSLRKLDRETRIQHELDIKISEINSTRYATCKIVVNLNDINDNRPIVNDIELIIYNKLDEKLINELNVPIANAIAIDPDQISKLTYSIVSVRYLSNVVNKNKRNKQQQQQQIDHQLTEHSNSEENSTKIINNELLNLFNLNTTNGNLYATKTEMPCSDCTILVQYKANDIGRLKTRVSRKSTIKFHIKPLPKTMEANQDESTLAYTFDLNLVNASQPESNLILLNVNEDTKLGEKLYQIKTRQKYLKTDQMTFVYYCLLDANNELNQTFYMSNHDGALYLIKQLDYESVNRFFNLTILVTNWLGQNDYVYIQVYVQDVNDNRPQFETTSIYLNETIDLLDNNNNNNFETKFSLVNAYDMDDLDDEKLTFKIEDCFYLTKNILIKKPATANPNRLSVYPLCSRQFMELIDSDDWMNKKKKSISLKLNLNNFNSFLKNSTDYYLKQNINSEPIINFNIDISVRDSSHFSAFTRVQLNIYLKKQSNPFIQNKVIIVSKNRQLVREENLTYGFRKAKIGCKCPYSDRIDDASEDLFKTTQIIISIENSAIYNLNTLKDLIYYPIWSQIKLNASIDENLPPGSWLSDDLNGKKFTAKAYLDNQVLEKIQNLLPSQNVINSIVFLMERSMDEYFEIDSNSGYIRSKIETDYELFTTYKLNLIVCLLNLDQILMNNNKKICFKQVSVLDIEIFNKNDNEPKMVKKNNNELSLNIFNTTELIRSMSLFKFKAQDLDNQLLKYQLIQVKSSLFTLDNNNNNNKCKLNDINPTSEWFDLFQLDNDYLTQCIKLTDIGYDSLIKLASKINQNHLDNCYFSIELTLTVNDGLFTNEISFNLNLMFDDTSTDVKKTSFLKNSIKNNGLIAPILNSIEINENINTNLNEPLLSITDLIIKHLNTNYKASNSTDYLDDFNLLNHKLVQFDLRNYQNYFHLNETDGILYAKNQSQFQFDRETRDTYELFISVKFNDFSIAKRYLHLIPSQFRVLIKLTDFNDNVPKFYLPSGLKMLTNRHQFEYNKTLNWKDSFKSNKTIPILNVKANDLDIGLNGLVKYELVDDLNLLKINEKTGSVYLISNIQNDDEFSLSFIVQASDQGQLDKLKSYLNVKLNFINLNENQTSNVYFNQTFYQFDIPESIKPGSLIGFVNSSFNLFSSTSGQQQQQQLVFSIIDGDYDQQFEIDYQSGAIYSRVELDYETKNSYLFTVSVYNTFNTMNRKQHSNATVQINVLNVNDNEPKFDKYEYEIEIEENLEKMSPIFRLNATDSDSSQIKYQLLNHLDKFYINELNGIIFNKITFDYEQMRNEADETTNTTGSSSHLNDYFYNSFEYLNLIQLKIKAYDEDMLETYCILTIKIQNVNDNPPQFEKALFSSHIQVYEDNEDSYNNKENNNSIQSYLLDETKIETNYESLQFVTKISAKDIDSKLLYYSILKQTQTIDDDQLHHQSAEEFEPKQLNQLAVNSLFQIDNITGIVYLNLNKYKLLKRISYQSKSMKTSLKQLTTFNLQLAVSDTMLSSQSRLTVQIESLTSDDKLNMRPIFKTNLISLNFNLTKLIIKKVDNISLINLSKNLAVKSSSYLLALNLDHLNDLFSIKSNKNLYLNLKKFNAYLKKNSKNLIDLIYQLPVTACNTIQTGMCDQMIVKLNITDLQANKWKDKSLNETKNENEKLKISFAYSHGSVTIQQQQANVPNAVLTTNEPLNENGTTTTSSVEDDYYFDYNYESNERFYYEIKANNLYDESLSESFDTETNSKQSKPSSHFEFELFNCVYTSLNVTYANSSISKQIKQFINHNSLMHSHHRLTLQQLKSLFSLNKHNGVLSSRKIINVMLPGVYLFNIRIKSNSSLTSSNDLPYEILDSMMFKLIILPPNNFLKPNFKNLYNYFKFNREYYKFKVDNQKSLNQTEQIDLGQLKLINKFQPPKNNLQQRQTATANNFKIDYKLIENKQTNSMMNLFDLNAKTGWLRFKLEQNNKSIELIKPYLKNEYEFVIYALASVNIENLNSTSSNNLEYICEIIIDFKPLLASSSLINDKDLQDKNYLVQLEKNGEFVKFGSKQHSLKLIENRKNLNLEIYRFVAFSHVTERNLSIQYSAEFDNNDLFHIEPSTGLLIQTKTIDDLKLFTFKIKACVINELGLLLSQIECGLSNVQIEFIYTNDNAPLFEQKIYSEKIREDALPGTVVLTVQAHDLDLHKKQQTRKNIEYFILDGDYYNQFAISSDGKVYTRLMLDREIKKSYSLVLMAFDGRFKGLSQLNIDVLDVNDNRPHCIETMINLKISENATVGTSIYEVKAYDPDQLSLSYEILTNEENFLIDQIHLNRTGHNNRAIREKLAGKHINTLPFHINEKSGSIRLTEPLDYEIQRSYSFFVRILKTSEQTNENKNNRNHRSFKTILPWSSYCLVKIEIKILDENDNRPEFTTNNKLSVVNITEHAQVGTLITQLKSIDIDSLMNSIVRYSIIDFNNLFEINSRSGLITLATNNLDREIIGNSLNLTVRAYDSLILYSESIVTLNLIDLNDNHPKFSQKELYLTIEENLPIGTQIAFLNATDSDSNSTTQYFFNNKNETNNEFLIEKHTGKLKVNTNLDYETKNQYVFYVKASDPYLTNNALENNNSIIKIFIDLIDLNDNTPQFNETRLVYYIAENSPINSTLGRVNAFDLDKTAPNNQFEFEIVNGNNLDYFRIDKTTGVLFNNVLFDYESLKEKNQLNMDLTVVCIDKGNALRLSNQTRVNINIQDVNDNIPMFWRINQTFVIRENFQLNHEIAKFKITDPDTFGNGGPPFKFEIIDQYRNNYKNRLLQPVFTVNKNGSLILVKKVTSYETYFIQLRCFDSGMLSSDTYLTVKIADELSNEPKLNNTLIEIITIGSMHEYESVKILSNQAIGQLKAFDPDQNDKLTYELNSESLDIDPVFKLDKTTGILKTTNDLIESSSFNFKPLVTDSKFETESNLNIKITNVNTDCYTNSLFIKFNVWSTDHISVISLGQFYANGYMKRFKDMLVRMLNTNKNNYEFGSRLTNFNKSNILIIGLRHLDLGGNVVVSYDETNLESQMIGSIIEIVFSIRKNSPLSNRDDTENNECLDGKLISKMLNKRRTTLIKRMRTPISANDLNATHFKIKLIDLSFNSACNKQQDKAAKLVSVCTTNVALQNCLMKFKSYYDPDTLCETDENVINTDKCYLMPKYEWHCDTVSDLPAEPISLTTTTLKNENSINFISKLINQNKTNNLDQNKYGTSCKKPFNPCKNNAICKQVRVASILTNRKGSNVGQSNYKVRVHCFCPNGFKGPFCEDDIDECNTNEFELSLTTTNNNNNKNNENGPCITGAKCQNTYGSYICNCSSHPPSTCYNTLSPQYSASVSDKTTYLLRNHKYSNYIYNTEKKRYEKIETKSEYELLNESDDETVSTTINGEEDEETTDYLLFGSISTKTVRQALLGVFGAVCGILIILTFAAAIVCKMNISRRRLKKRYLNETELNNEKMSSLLEEPTTSNTDSDNNIVSSSSVGDIDRSNSSSPCSFKTNNGTNNTDIISKTMKNKKKYVDSSTDSCMSNDAINIMPIYGSDSSNVLIKNSTQSTTGGESQTVKLTNNANMYQNKFNKKLNNNNNRNSSVKTDLNIKKSKYTINNLLFAKLNSQKLLNNQLSSGSQATSSICESLGSTSTAKNEIYEINDQKELNGMSSFGRENIGKKINNSNNIELKARESFYKYDSICSLSSQDKIDSAVLLDNLEQESAFKYNTISQQQQPNYFSLVSNKSKTVINNTKSSTSTFMPIKNKNENLNDSIHTVEDNTQGIYH